ALAARYLLVDVLPAHAAHRTRARSEAKLGNLGPVQPVQRSAICFGVPQPRYSGLARHGWTIGAVPYRPGPPGAPLNTQRSASTCVSAGTGHPASVMTGSPARERHSGGRSPPPASRV